MESRTKDLLQSLYSNEELSSILKNNHNEFVVQPLCHTLADLLEQKGLTRAQAIRNS